MKNAGEKPWVVKMRQDDPEATMRRMVDSLLAPMMWNAIKESQCEDSVRENSGHSGLPH